MLERSRLLRKIINIFGFCLIAIWSFSAMAGAGKKSFQEIGFVAKAALGIDPSMIHQGPYNPDCGEFKEERIVNFGGTIGDAVRRGEYSQCTSHENGNIPAARLVTIRKDSSGREIINTLGTAWASGRGDIFVTAEHTLTENKFDGNNPNHVKKLHILIDEQTESGCKPVSYPVDYVKMEGLSSSEGGGSAVIKLKHSISSNYEPIRLASDSEIEIALSKESKATIFSFPDVPVTRQGSGEKWAITSGSVFSALPTSSSSRFGHDIDTEGDSSGAPVTIVDSSGGRVALGIHIWGARRSGFASSSRPSDIEGEGNIEVLDRNNRINEALKVNQFLRDTIQTILNKTPGPKLVRQQAPGVEA